MRIYESMTGFTGDLNGASAADLAFHRAIAEATGIALFPVLIDSLSGVLLEFRRRRATLIEASP